MVWMGRVRDDGSIRAIPRPSTACKGEMSMAKKGRYTLTPMGLLMAKMGEVEGKKGWDALELAARRAVRKGGIAAVLFEEAGGRFVEVERHPSTTLPALNLDRAI